MQAFSRVLLSPQALGGSRDPAKTAYSGTANFAIASPSCTRGSNAYPEPTKNRIEARSLVVAGLHQEAFEQLGLMLSNPGVFRVNYISLDPVFDAVRNAPEFVALMKKHR